MKMLIRSVAVCGSESLAVNKTNNKNLDASEMWVWRSVHLYTIDLHIIHMQQYYVRACVHTYMRTYGSTYICVHALTHTHAHTGDTCTVKATSHTAPRITRYLTPLVTRSTRDDLSEMSTSDSISCTSG